jgi:CO dehydrogenase/acetyl-CoA synthase delta subunit
MAGYTKSTVLKLSSEIIDLREALDSMLIESVECVRLEDMTIELKEAIAVGNELLHGPKSEYITQDPEFDKRSV